MVSGREQAGPRAGPGIAGCALRRTGRVTPCSDPDPDSTDRAPRPALQRFHRPSHRGAAALARDRRRFLRRVPLLRGGGGAPALGGGIRGGGEWQGGTALRLGRYLRSGSLALPRRLAQRGPALWRSPALGLAARGARPQRQRNGVERGQARGAAGHPAAGRARCARDPLPRPCSLRAQRGVASHRAGYPQPSPRLPLRVRLPASRAAALGRQGESARPDRGRRISDRPPPAKCAWRGSR